MIDPTARGDAVAAKVREWYEANRESWWQRHRPQIFSYRDNSGIVADNFALELVNAVLQAAEIDQEMRRLQDEASIWRDRWEAERKDAIAAERHYDDMLKRADG